MAEDKKDLDIQEIYKGTYKYFNEGRTYSEENFKVYKNFDHNTYIFMAEILTRVANGQFLKINTSYSINMKYEPLQVTVEKSLGDQYSKESFTPDKNLPQLQYEFETNKGTKSLRVQTPAKYHISTPATCSAMIFTKAKKYDPTIMNSFYILSSENIWEYKKAIETKLVYFKCDNIHVQEELQVGKKTLSGTLFEVFTEDDEKQENKPVKYFLSKHLAIPYQCEVDKDTKVEVKNLQDLQPSRMEDFL